MRSALSSADVAASRFYQLVQHDDDSSEAAAVLEKVFGDDRLTLEWWRNGLMRCRGVVRIDDRNRVGRGTGFLVNGKELHPSMPDLVVMTNDTSFLRGSIRATPR